MELKGKHVLIIGSGISGISAAKLVAEVGAYGAYITIFDGNENLDPGQIAEKLPKELHAQIYTGTLPTEAIDGTDLVIVSPGVPVDTEFMEQFRRRGIQIWGEVELAYRYAQGRLIAITGTNGKTTTTALAGHIMKDYMDEVFVVGNIGIPYTSIACETTKDSVTVAEISSFQLETIHAFRPDVSAVLNITPDHLNRHHTMENYVAMKEAIAANQGPDSRCILNYEDAYTRAFGERTCAEPFYFSSKRVLEKGIYLKDGGIYLADGNGPKPVMHLSETQLPGIHNAENMMAAIGLCHCMGVPLAQIGKSVRTFKAVEHRIEFVTEKKGVVYYNDSKGTNPDAAIRGIRAMDRPTVLIGGGYDKDSSYDEWVEAFDGKVTWLVLLGQTKEKIAACARRHGFTNIVMAETLEEAVHICAGKARRGDAVLLSPACASWGMFPNYEVRGNLFKELVNNLED
ncbi:MAG: UDP-N-acetylmuramoyl-L-alanine--D-glutamate ligase [Lachnospiraceae bacterium]|nr:UDP-N-acetylmuramoyl-L-alanine--D-glutamate ligase [Lachnospiraceae bacterium]